jgi:hypothetical protein
MPLVKEILSVKQRFESNLRMVTIRIELAAILCVLEKAQLGIVRSRADQDCRKHLERSRSLCTRASPAITFRFVPRVHHERPH